MASAAVVCVVVPHEHVEQDVACAHKHVHHDKDRRVVDQKRRGALVIVNKGRSVRRRLRQAWNGKSVAVSFCNAIANRKIDDGDEIGARDEVVKVAIGAGDGSGKDGNEKIVEDVQDVEHRRLVSDLLLGQAEAEPRRLEHPRRDGPIESQLERRNWHEPHVLVCAIHNIRKHHHQGACGQDEELAKQVNCSK